MEPRADFQLHTPHIMSLNFKASAGNLLVWQSVILEHLTCLKNKLTIQVCIKRLVFRFQESTQV